jgi:HlyD family secretion protein
MKKSSDNAKSLRIAFIGLFVFIAVLFIIGMYINKPEDEIIQGEAEAGEVRVSGKIPGRIIRFSVEEGDHVKAGDTLAVIDSPELNARMEQAVAAKNAALAQERKAQKGTRDELITGAYEMWQKALAGVDIAKKSYDRVQRLYDKGVLPAQKRDEAEAGYKAALATANAAKSQYDMAVHGTEAEDKQAADALVDRASGAVHEVQAFMGETVLQAPISGEVSEIFPKRGELVGAGAPVMNLVDLNDIWFVFNVREDLLSDLKMGLIVTAVIPSLGNRQVNMQIFHLRALASYATWKATKTTGQFDAKTFEIKARPISQVPDLRPGMSALLVKNIHK